MFDPLKAQLRGPLFLPGQTEYEESRHIWNAMIDRHPAAIVRCLGVADIVACVNFARTHKLPISIKGGGHNIAGLAVCEGGLMLDMSLMRGVWVDPVSRIAHAQPGCLLGDVDRETQLHGLAAVLGFVSNTGIAGLTVGGGFGYLTRRFGWTCDNVLSIEVVTAEGRIVRASEKENADLLWGLRGGGGNFGIVTDFEYRLYPVGPEIAGGLIAWRAEETSAAFEMYRTLTLEAPPELACAAVLRPAPPAPWLPKEIHGKPIFALVVCHSGPVAEAEGYLERVKKFGKPVGDILSRRSYVSQQSILDLTQPKGRRYYWKSEYLPGLDPGIMPKIIAHAARISSSHSSIILFPIQGALNQLPQGHSAAGNRDAAFALNITAAWESAEKDRENIAWAREAWEDMRSYSTGGTYINFQTEDEGDDRTRAAYGSNYEQLAKIKRKWDPENLFRTNKNIAPKA